MRVVPRKSEQDTLVEGLDAIVLVRWPDGDQERGDALAQQIVDAIDERDNHLDQARAELSGAHALIAKAHAEIARMREWIDSASPTTPKPDELTEIERLTRERDEARAERDEALAEARRWHERNLLLEARLAKIREIVK